jgi:carboxymethylenebutenolidase
MPVYRPEHIEYAIVSGRIHIALENGQMLPAFWSHPNIGGLFPGIALMHDWWGITDTERHLANMFAQAGFYVIVPDMYGGTIAKTPNEAMKLVEALGAKGFTFANTALHALETHHRCNRSVAAIGLGMGGTLAYQSAIDRKDLEAAVAYYGFPQRHFGLFKGITTPILAIYGSKEPHIAPEVRERLRVELAESSVEHEFVVLEGAARDFMAPGAPPEVRQFGKEAWQRTLHFLDKHLDGPTRPQEKQVL